MRSVLCRRYLLIIGVWTLTTVFSLAASPQSKLDLETFLRQNIGLTAQEVAAIRAGQAVSKALPSRTPAEVFLFGAIHINAAPERYVEYFRDVERLRNISNYLSLGVFGRSPRLADLKGFEFEADDVQALRNCKPGDCQVQLPAGSMDELRRTINWSSSAAADEVNLYLQKAALERVAEYQRLGTTALGSYNDKRDPTDVARSFSYILSYTKVVPERLPDFYNYLLSYPKNPPANVENLIYWARVKFGLKPTLRVVQKFIMPGKPGDPVLYAMAEKQLYASHYFETALDLSFCLRDDANPGSAFYLMTLMGSEQDGLDGVKGALVRKVAVGRSVSNLQVGLTSIRDSIERGPR